MSSPSSSSSSIPFSGLQNLPPRLTAALSAVSYPGLPFVSDKFSLASPGLFVTGLPYQLAFPLLRTQADQLASLPRDAASANGGDHAVRVPPDRLKFDNPAWLDNLKDLVDHAATFLGAAKGNVKYDLDELVLYRAGDCVQRRQIERKPAPVFGTLIVQLPSHFKGGEVVFHHDGEETVFANGADDGSSRFNSFFTVSYADVDREMRPIQEGCRITLLYNLSWIGDGLAPAASVESIAQVATALREHAEARVDGDWHLAFTLAHRYDDEDLEEKGTDALKGVDWRNVNTLTMAARIAGMKELDFLIGKFSQQDVEIGEFVDGQFELVQVKEGDISCENVYWGDDGEKCTYDLKWVDWRAALQFTQVSQTEPDEDSTDSHGDEVMMTRRTNYLADAVVVWARSRRSESLFKGEGYDVNNFLIHGSSACPSCPQDVRAGRMLGCIERRGCDDVLAWKQTEEVLEFCLEGGFHEQASSAIRFASMIDETEDLEKILYRYVSQHGWDVIGDAVTLYLCSSYSTEMSSIDCRLWTLFQLFPYMPARTAMDALTVVASFLEHHNGNIAPEIDKWTSTKTEPYREKLQELWVPLLSVVGELEQKLIHDDETTSALEIIVDGIVTLMDGFTLRHIEPIHDVLSNQLAKTTPQLDKLSECSQRRFFSARAERFEHEAHFVIEHKTAFHHLLRDSDAEYDQSSDYRREAQRKKDWVNFMSFCGRVVSADNVAPEISRLVEKVIETIAVLSKRDFDALADALPWFDEALKDDVLLLIEEKLRDSRSEVYERDERREGYVD